jgi:DivIVA domain-containing protein
VVTLLGLLGVLAVLFATAVLATRSDPLLAEASPDRPDLALPDGTLGPDDVEQVRFSMAVRGYRMSEVDDVLSRLADELAQRDRRIAELEQAAGPAERVSE